MFEVRDETFAKSTTENVLRCFHKFLEALARLAYLICDRSEYNGVDEDLSRDEIAQEHLAQWLWRQGGGGASGHDHHK